MIWFLTLTMASYYALDVFESFDDGCDDGDGGGDGDCDASGNDYICICCESDYGENFYGVFFCVYIVEACNACYY